MANYIPPKQNIPFTFGESGYSKPDFKDVTTGASSDSFTALQASISVMQLYQESTYTYTKNCQTIIVGYGTHGIQTIQLPCEYGGIRDIGASIYGNPHNLDLSALISATVYSQDLSAWFRCATRSSKDFYGWYRPATRAKKNLGGYMKFIRGLEVPQDLGAILQEAIQPVDVKALLNVIEIQDLGASIKGEWWKDTYDISADFYRVYFRQHKSISSYIRGWDTKDLSANISSYWTKDLPVKLTGGFFGISKNLNAYLLPIPPYDLTTYLQGYDTLSLSASLVESYDPNDLQAYITTVQPVDLVASVYGMQGIGTKKNLKAFILGVRSNDLLAYIRCIETLDLSAYIDAKGKYLDLEAEISPRTINIKRLIQIPLFEHFDLKAVINFNCFGSSYKDLSSYIYPIRKLDLKGYIIGWYHGTADNVGDLRAYINCADYNVQSTIEISGSPTNKRHSICNVFGKVPAEYKLFDTITVGGGYPIDLSAYITGVLHNKDLAATLKAAPIANFTTVPSWIDLDESVVVINMSTVEEQWVRFVELMFFTNSTDDYHYFYVSGTNKIYKVDHDRTWQIYVTGYTENDDSSLKRTKINKKFIFNVTKYKDVDEAIRDMIDRVSLYKHYDLAAKITTYTFEHANLSAYVKVKVQHRWSSTITATLKCMTETTLDLSGTLYVQWLQDSYNLTATIVGRSYTPPAGDAIEFNFEDDGYESSSTEYNNMNWTYLQAEKYWK